MRGIANKPEPDDEKHNSDHLGQKQRKFHKIGVRKYLKSHYTTIAFFAKGRYNNGEL